MSNKHTKNNNKYQQFTDDRDFDGDIEEEYEVDAINYFLIK